MGDHKHGRDRRCRKHRQGCDLHRQDQPQGHRTVGAEPAILHDLERRISRRTAANPVEGVRQAVLVKGTRQEDRRRGGEQKCQKGWKDLKRNPEDRRGDGTDEASDGRIIAHGRCESFGRIADIGRQRQTGQELHRQQEDRDFALDLTAHSGCFVLAENPRCEGDRGRAPVNRPP